VALGRLPGVRVTGDGVRLADVEDRDGREADTLLDLERAGLVDGGFSEPVSKFSRLRGVSAHSSVRRGLPKDGVTYWRTASTTL
jgi:hypothetical protein